MEYKDLIKQNVAPENADEIGVYNRDGKKIGIVAIDNLKKNRSKLLYSFGLLSDVHHDYSYDKDYFVKQEEVGPQSASDLANALKYFSDKNVDFICVCGDLTVQQGETATAFDAVTFLKRDEPYKTPSHLSDLDSYRYNALKLNPNTPIFIARGNHDIGAIDGASKEEYLERNIHWLSKYELWDYFTEIKNIPDNIHITYQNKSNICDSLNNIKVSNDTIEKVIYGRDPRSYNFTSFNYAKLKEMGIDAIYVLFQGTMASYTIPNAIASQNAGVKMYLDALWSKSSVTTINNKYPETLAGFHIEDEPFEEFIGKTTDSGPTSRYNYGGGTIGNCKTLIEWLQQNDSRYIEHKRFVNCFPNYAYQGQIKYNYWGKYYNGKYYIEKDGKYAVFSSDGNYVSNDDGVTFREATQEEIDNPSIQKYGTYTPQYVTTDEFERYVEAVAQIPDTILVGDCYGVTEDGNRECWEDYLSIMKRVSETQGKELWQYVCCTAHNRYPKPTYENMRLQVYINLLYGAKGIIYYLYGDKANPTYYESPFDENGKTTETFEILKELNNNEFIEMGKLFKKSEIKYVKFYKTGSDLPDGIVSIGGDVVIAEIFIDNIELLAILNYSAEKEITVGINNLIKYGIDKELNIYDIMPETSSITIDAGDIAVLGYYKETKNSTNYYFTLDGTNDVFVFLGCDINIRETSFYFNESVDWIEHILKENKDKRVFVFTHPFFENEAGDGQFTHEDGTTSRYSWNNFGNETYYRLESLSRRYSNVVWFSGHSHLSLLLQGGGYDKCKFNNISRHDEKSCWNVHVPSCAYPRDSYIGNMNNASEGCLVKVYDKCIEVYGILFKDENANDIGYTNKFIPKAIYRIDTEN